MRPLIPIVTALLLLGAAPSVADERGSHPGGCGACGGGHPGAAHNANVNVNVNANATAHAGAYAGAGGYISARAYDLGTVGVRGPVYGGLVSTEEGGGYDYGYGYGHVGGGYGPVVMAGPGYGPSRPHGYAVGGFGRRYVTTDRRGADRVTADRCGRGCGPVAPPPVCRDRCDRGSHGRYGDYGSSARGSGATWSVRESYSERMAWSAGYRDDDRSDHGRDRTRPDEAPRYVPIPYDAAPLEPVTRGGGLDGPLGDYAPPAVLYSAPAMVPDPAVPPGPSPVPPVVDYYGDLPPGDAGEGMPYRQEPGERG